MPITKKLAHRGLSLFFERLNIQEKINLARHLSIVVKAGLPLIEGLKIIQNQTRSKTLNEILSGLIADVDKGQSLADGLEEHKHIFGDFFINIIRVGESSGTLSQNLLYLADELKKSKELKSKIKSAMVYPMVILFATVGITAFLTFVVFPKIIPVFTGLNVELPATTQFLISVLEFSKTYGIYVLLGAVALIIGFRFALRNSAFRYIIHRCIFLIPVVGDLAVNINMTNFARILGLLLRSGIRIVEAVTITANTFQNMVYKKILIDSTDQIRKGEQLAQYLSEKEKFFPLLLSGMIRIGENTGNLEDNLFYLSEYYTEEVDGKVRSLTTLLEPIMLLFMGILVGFVAISIILPIYSISSGLSQ